MFRVNFVFVTLICLAAIFSGRLILTFLSTPSNLLDEAYSFLIPCLVSYPSESIVFRCSGILQAYGRSEIAGGIILSSFLLNIGILKPFLIFGLKVPLASTGYSNLIAFSLMTLISFILLARGKLGFDFRCRMLFQRFSPETKSALIIGSTGFIGSVASMIPGIIKFRYIGKASSKQGIQEIVGEILTVGGKLNAIIISFPVAISSSCFANGCFCFKAKLYSRLKKIILFSCLIIFSYSAIWTLIFVIRAGFVAQIFITSSDFLHYANIYLRVSGYTIIFVQLFGLFVQFFLIIGKPFLSIFLLVLHGIIGSLSLILFYEGKNDDSLKMMYASTLSDSMTFAIVSILFVIFFIKVQRVAIETKTTDLLTI
jgi:Na+-driven multidrug efflux pump